MEPNAPGLSSRLGALLMSPAIQRNVVKIFGRIRHISGNVGLEAGMRAGRRMADAASDDLELVRRLARGDQAAFHLCYERYQGPIFRFAWHMSGNQTTAEEVTQEVFLRLIHKPKKFNAAKGTLAGYLFGIARNVMRRELSAGSLDVALEDEHLSDDRAFSSEADVLTELDRQERLELLHKSVLALPAPYREALVLCDLEEMSYPEAATVLDCPEGTVASRLHRARAMLKTRLQSVRCVR